VIRVDQRFASMGSTARVTLESDTRSEAELERHAAVIRSILADVEATLTRFRPDSELSLLNADPRPAIPASALLRHFALAVRAAGARSGGLVDATLLAPLEHQGYIASRAGVPAAGLDQALAAAPPPRPAQPAPARAHAGVGVDEDGRIVRPPGVRLDSGGIGKGLAADLAAITVPTGIRYAISCGGDLAVGGTPPASRWEVAVHSARTGAPVHRLRVRAGGVATSGISSRLWRRDDGAFAHHLLDPSTGAPAWTGLVAVTAVAATAVDAEVLAKTAVLSGPARARTLLARRGGVLQHDDGRVEMISPPPIPPVVRLRRPLAERA
jgi:thiamine biosynthesis lipoprotein